MIDILRAKREIEFPMIQQRRREVGSLRMIDAGAFHQPPGLGFLL